MSLFIILWIVVRLLFHSNLISVVFVYILSVIIIVISFIINNSGITPLLFLLLFNRRILIFLIFCVLLYNSKFHSNLFHLIISFILPLTVIEIINPIFIPNISHMFNFFSFIHLVIPSVILFLMSVSNIEITLRS